MKFEEKQALGKRMTRFYTEEATARESQLQANMARRFSDIADRHVKSEGGPRRRTLIPSLLPADPRHPWRGGFHSAYTDGTVCSGR
jgi:hypothetical protein